MTEVFVSGSFDNIQSRAVRFLQEAARLGRVHALLWSDGVVSRLEGQSPRFPQAERRYILESIRYVDQVTIVDDLPGRGTLPLEAQTPGAVWAVDAREHSDAGQALCAARGITYRVIGEEALQGFPEHEPVAAGGRKKVVVTGCYDWLHSGHVRFFEEVSTLGDLYVVVGNDANVRLLKGEGHPLFPQDLRRYMVGAVRFVKEALITSGMGWMDAEPEIIAIRPDIYAVNEDGDKPEKRAFCVEHGLEYVVLKRAPKEGLPRRESTHLRGF